MATVIIHSDLGAQENKICHCLHFFPSICCEVMGQDAMILVFWMLSFKSAFYSPLLSSSSGLPGDSDGKESACSAETQVWSLGQKDPLEKQMLLTPVFLPGISHGQRSLAGYSPCGHRVRPDWVTDTFTFHCWLVKAKSQTECQRLQISIIFFHRSTTIPTHHTGMCNGIKKGYMRHFPDGPVVKNLPYNSGDASLIPGQRTKIPHASEQLNLSPVVVLSPCITTSRSMHHNKRSHMMQWRALGQQLRPKAAK